MIKLDKVCKQYHYSADKVLDNLTVDIESGIATLLIDVQSGKSTIAKLILGLEQYDSGSISVLGAEVGQCHDIALLDSRLLLWDKRTVLYNLMYPLIVRGMSKSQAKQQAIQQATKYSLHDVLNRRVGTLEHNRQIQLVVARATIRQLQLAIVDNLDSVCDDNSWQWVVGELTEHCQNILILTSHVDKAIGTVYVVKDNQLVHTGSAQTAKAVIQNSAWLYNMIGEYCEQ